MIILRNDPIFQRVVGTLKTKLGKNSLVKFVDGFVSYRKSKGEQIENLETMAVNDIEKALQYFKTKHCLKDVEEVKHRVSYSAFTPEELKEMMKWAAAEYEKVREAFEEQQIVEKKAMIEKLAQEVAELESRQRPTQE
nr:MAG TPA: Cell cycle protein [Caudoviricetes sp.]